MNKKQNDHGDHYHITDEDDLHNVFNENIQDNLEELTITDEPTAEPDDIIKYLESLVSVIGDVSRDEMQAVVEQSISSNEINNLTDIYHELFDDVPNNDNLKLYVLNLFNKLCIPIVRYSQ